MQKLLLVLLVGCLMACSGATEKSVNGKWYTYAENGDYMELWIGENLAMSYLSSIDEFLLYELNRNGEELKFSLLESRIINEHNFTLNIKKSSEELFQASFIGDNRVDSLKTYFLVSRDEFQLASTLEGNKDNMQELFSRMEDSHAGHNH